MFLSNCKVKKVFNIEANNENAEKLWIVSSKLIGLDWTVFYLIKIINLSNERLFWFFLFC